MDSLQIKGILTSRIEQKGQSKQPYYYGFFKLEGQEGEIPVVFKEKPAIAKGSEVKLTGQWAQSNGNRPSFTATAYQLLSDPPEITIQSLRETIQPLLSFTLDQKQEWNQRTDYLFKKWEELKKIEQLGKLGSQYLQAYLLLKNVDYSASTNGKLVLEDFNQAEYLSRMASEIEPISQRVKAISRKEASN